MGKKSGSAGQRAKKKAEKAQKRKKVVAQKRLAMTARAAASGGLQWSPSTEGYAGLAREAGVTYYEAAYLGEHFTTPDGGSRKLPEGMWTLTRVAGLTTEALVERMAQLGVQMDEGAFVAETGRFGSAVAYAREAWVPRLAAGSDVHARDFACLAACELWKRWRPEAPSQEMLIEATLSGQTAARNEDYVVATEKWLQLWDLLRPRLEREGVRTTQAAEAVLGGAGNFFEWTGDLALVAGNPEVPAVLKRRVVDMLAEMNAQFTGEPTGWALSLTRERAALLFRAGEREEAERLLREQIEGHPDKAGAYAALADLWAHGDGPTDANISRALTLLEQAAAHPVEDGEEWDLDERMQALREALATPEGDAPAAAG